MPHVPAALKKKGSKMPGVVEANVNFCVGKKSNVRFNPAATNIEELQKKKVEALGYHVRTEKAELDITGMTCAACATRIEKGLNKLPGVTKATVNLALETAAVEYNPSEVGTIEMVQRVEKLGYGATVKGDKTVDIAQQRQQELDAQTGKFFYFSLIFERTFTMGNGKSFFSFYIFLFRCLICS
ncbi:hypothetical protein GCM10020331_054250 [Ectobacillus funiculus]